MNPLELQSYDYKLPREQIATEPLKNRGEAKLLVYHKENQQIEHVLFRDFFHYVDPSYTLVLNNTQVLKARFYGIKQTGKRQELFYHQHINADHFYLQIRGRVKVGDRFCVGEEYEIEVLRLLEGGLREAVLCDKTGERLDKEAFWELLEKIGSMPIPPYLGREARLGKEEEYQNPFARYKGAVAAPTASLHFSYEDYSRVQKQYQLAFVTLHVGAGTFMGVESEFILNHTMHAETFMIPEESQQIFNSTQKLLAIGTTSMRVVEEYARSMLACGESRLFLNPANLPIRCHALLTNFHLPKSTLLMLVSSLVGIEELHRIYREAIEQKYRFYSYGDAMLVI